MSEIVQISVRGRVQGVGFRYFTEQTARRLNVAGWVQNRPDGSVEAVARLSVRNRSAFLDALRRGPPGARVDSLDVVTAPVGTLCAERGFAVRY